MYTELNQMHHELHLIHPELHQIYAEFTPDVRNNYTQPVYQLYC